MDKLIFVVTVVAIILVLIMATVPNVYAGGARNDYPGDATNDELIAGLMATMMVLLENMTKTEAVNVKR